MTYRPNTGLSVFSVGATSFLHLRLSGRCRHDGVHVPQFVQSEEPSKPCVHSRSQTLIPSLSLSVLTDTGGRSWRSFGSVASLVRLLRQDFRVAGESRRSRGVTQRTLPLQLRVLRQGLLEDRRPSRPPVDAHRREGLRVRHVWQGVQPRQPAATAPAEGASVGPGQPVRLNAIVSNTVVINCKRKYVDKF